MDLLKSISPGQLLFITVVITILIIAESDCDELDSISAVFSGIGGLIAVFSVQRDFLKGKQEEAARNDFYNRQIALLEECRDSSRKRR